MKIIKSHLTKHRCYTANKKITVKGLMLHSVGCNQPSAEVFVKKWNSPTSGDVCVHAFIDANTGDIYNTLPWNHRGWHCGRSGNNTHIGVEMCEPATIKYTGGASWVDLDAKNTKAAVLRTYNAAVELFAFLCKEYNLNPLAKGVIVSHSEGYKIGIASNHGDVEHIWRKFGLTMDGFRKDVKNAMTENMKQEEKPKETKKELYRVRASWKKAETQTGAFYDINNAIAQANRSQQNVYNSKGKVVYSFKKSTAKKSVDEIAKEVIAGKWGNGRARKEALEKAGYNYSEVQKRVNMLLR